MYSLAKRALCALAATSAVLAVAPAAQSSGVVGDAVVVCERVCVGAGG